MAKQRAEARNCKLSTPKYSNDFVQDLAKLDIELELFSMNPPGRKFNAHLFFKDIITFDEDENGAERLLDAATKFEELRARVRRKEFKKRSQGSISFWISPDIELAVKMYVSPYPLSRNYVTNSFQLQYSSGD